MLTRYWNQVNDTLLGAQARAIALRTEITSTLTTRGVVDLRSRRGIEGAVWSVMALFVVAAVFIGVIVVLGPTIMALAATATTRLRTNPGW